MKKQKDSKILLLWYSHPRIAIALMLVGINLVVIFLFTIILSIVSGNSFIDELAYLFTYTMCSDGIYDFVNNDEDLMCFIIKIVLTIVQMVIFSGALIGFTTDLLSSTFDKRLENKGKMYLANHYVFLNWSTIGQNIIYDLSFLDGNKTVVILTDDDREEVMTSIDNIFTSNNRKKKGLRIFVKKGNPTSIKHLSDVSIDKAKYIGVLLQKCENEDSDYTISTKDLASFKLLLSIIGEAPNANIVVETESEIAKEKVEQLIESTHPEDVKRVSIFSHNAVIGHVLGKSTINPLFASLYHNILSFDGAEFYGIPSMDIEEALYKYNDCIPIINYDDDDEVDEFGNKQADQLYILSDNEKTLGEREKSKSFVKSLKYQENIMLEEFKLFIISDSNRTSFVTSEIDVFNKNYHGNIEYFTYSYADDINDIISIIINTEGKKKILLLSKEDDNGEAQDTEIFMSLLEFKRNKTIQNEVDIFVEIVNLNNLPAVKNLGIASVILSNKIISLYMLQLLTHSGSRKFYQDILTSNTTSGDVDFEILHAEQVLSFDNELKFSCYSELVQSFFIASNKSKMLIGYIKHDDEKQEIQLFCDKMDEPRNVVLNKKDSLIIIKY